MAVCPTTIPESVRRLTPAAAFLQAASIADRLPMQNEARQAFISLYRILESDLLSSPVAVTDEPYSLARLDPELFNSSSYFARRGDTIRCNLAMLLEVWVRMRGGGAAKQWSLQERSTYGWALIGGVGAWGVYHVVRGTPQSSLRGQSLLAVGATLVGMYLLR